MSCELSQCYYVPATSVGDAADAVRYIARMGKTKAAIPLTLPNGRVCNTPLGNSVLDRKTLKFISRPARLVDPGDFIGGEINVRVFLDESVEEFYDPSDQSIHRKRDRHGNRILYVPVEVGILLGQRFVEVSFSSETQSIGMMIQVASGMRDVLDYVDSFADGVLILGETMGELGLRAADGSETSLPIPETPDGTTDVDAIVDYFTKGIQPLDPID